MPSTVEQPESARPRETLGQRVQRLLNDRSITQSAFAEKVGMDRTELNRSLNGKRQFQSDEINWIASALGIPADELLEGMDLPAPLTKMRNELQSLAERVLQAEAERDRAKTEREAAETAVEEERAGWRQERDSLRHSATADRNRLESEIAEVRRAATRREKELQLALSAAEGQLAQSREALARSQAEFAKLRAAAALLQQQLKITQDAVAQERTAKVTTGVLAGLAGALLGGVLGSGTRTDDNDDDA